MAGQQVTAKPHVWVRKFLFTGCSEPQNAAALVARAAAVPVRVGLVILEAERVPVNIYFTQEIELHSQDELRLHPRNSAIDLWTRYYG